MKAVFMLAIMLFVENGTKLLAQSDTTRLGDLESRLERDTFNLDGSVSVSGLIQYGNENRTVGSLLSVILLGNSQYQIEPLTSIAYSTKPGRSIESEYLENIIFRYHQEHRFYPAIGLSFEKSYLRKLDYRLGGAALLVWNVWKAKDQLLKLGVGYNHDFALFVDNAFTSADMPVDGNYRRNSDQLYIRLKGKNSFFKKTLLLSYDLFYQPSITDFTDYRWTMIGNLDVPITKRIDFRTSVVSSYESIVAPQVSETNFRLTYGVNVKF